MLVPAEFSESANEQRTNTLNEKLYRRLERLEKERLRRQGVERPLRVYADRSGGQMPMNKTLVVVVALLIAMALAVIAQNPPVNPPAVLKISDEQRIERLERQVSALQAGLATIEQRTELQFKPLGDSK